ncbi:hypothetical protein IPM19_04420 [bacterium]|nr:MAG: hypothetical protein IPM19_04420 [bacterium]
MKVRMYLPAFIAGMIVVGAFCFSLIASANATRQVSGVLRMEIIEPYGEMPMQIRYFVQYWDGKNFRHTYIADKSGADFAAVLNKEVVISGRGTDDLFEMNELKASSKTAKQNALPAESTSSIQQRSAIGENPTVAPNTPFTMPQATLGFRNTLFMLAHRGAVPSTSYTPQQIKRWGMTDVMSANMFFRNSSFWKFGLKGVIDPEGDVTPWLPITVGPEDCFQGMMNSWRMQADDLAEAQGFSKTAYKFRVLLYAPMETCTLTASAQVGVFGDPNGVVYIFMQIPSSGTDEDLQDRLHTLIHEFNHSFGQAEHSNGQQFENGPILLQKDHADSLGTGLIMNHLINRIKFGWLSPAQRYPVVSSRGRHRILIQTPSRPGKGIGPNVPPPGIFIELRNLDGTLSDKVMVLETRSLMPYYDMFPSDVQGYVGGLGIRLVSKDLENTATGTVLIDSTPETECCKDAPLRPGRTFSMAKYGVTITTAASIRYQVWVTLDLGNNYPSDL